MPTTDPEKKRAQQRAYAEKNKEKRRAYAKAWYQANKHRPEIQEVRTKATKRWQEEHREQYLASKRATSRRYYERHKEEEQARSREKKNRSIAHLQAIVDAEKAAGCAECSERDPDCLDFHHRDPAQKALSVARMMRMHKPTEDELRAEIAKCIVLCANCHRKLHRAGRVGSE